MYTIVAPDHPDRQRVLRRRRPRDCRVGPSQSVQKDRGGGGVPPDRSLSIVDRCPESLANGRSKTSRTARPTLVRCEPTAPRISLVRHETRKTELHRESLCACRHRFAIKLGAQRRQMADESGGYEHVRILESAGRRSWRTARRFSVRRRSMPTMTASKPLPPNASPMRKSQLRKSSNRLRLQRSIAAKFFARAPPRRRRPFAADRELADLKSLRARLARSGRLVAGDRDAGGIRSKFAADSRAGAGAAGRQCGSGWCSFIEKEARSERRGRF